MHPAAWASERGYNGLLGLSKNPEDRYHAHWIWKRCWISPTSAARLLRTARCVEFKEPEVLCRLARTSCCADMACDRRWCVIGGDGSFTRRYARCASWASPAWASPAPSTTTWATPRLTLGYDTAVNVCVDAVRSIRATSRSHDRPHVVQVMGRQLRRYRHEDRYGDRRGNAGRARSGMGCGRSGRPPATA